MSKFAKHVVTNNSGNVVCFVPNGPKIVKMVDRWTECRQEWFQVSSLWVVSRCRMGTGGAVTSFLSKLGTCSLRRPVQAWIPQRGIGK